MHLLQRLDPAGDTPQPGDGIPESMCLRCGFRGPHLGATDCIDALRDQIATLQFRLNAGRGSKANSVMRAQAGQALS